MLSLLQREANDSSRTQKNRSDPTDVKGPTYPLQSAYYVGEKTKCGACHAKQGRQGRL